MIGGFLGALGGLAGGFEQGLQARQNMQYRQALMALTAERIKTAQFQRQQAQQQAQEQSLGAEGLYGSMFAPLPTPHAPQTQASPPPTPIPAAEPPPISPSPVPFAAPSAPPPTTLAAGTAPMPSGGSASPAPSTARGLAVGGGAFQSLADTDAQQAGIDPVFYKTLIGAESNWQPHVVNPIPVDGQHATGIAQFLPSTARQQHVDPLNPQQSLKGGAEYFATLLRQNGGDYVKAAQAYGTLPHNLNGPLTQGQRAVLQAGMAATVRHQTQTTLRIGQALGGAPTAQQGMPLAQQVVNTTPPAAITQMNPMAVMRAVAQRINATAPEGTPDNVKAMAWMQAMTMYSKFAGPQMKMAFDVWKANADHVLKAEQIRAQEVEAAARISQSGQEHADALAQRDQIAGMMHADRQDRLDFEKQKAGYGSAGGKPKTLNAPETFQVQSPDGKTTSVSGYVRQNADGTMQPVDIYGKPIQGKVVSASKLSGMNSGRNEQILGRMFTGALDAIADLKNIVELPVGASTGMLGIGGNKGTSMLDITADAAKRSASSQTVQSYNVYIVGIQRALATLEANGVYINQATMGNFDRLTVKPGDSYATVITKLAVTRQNVDNALDSMELTPNLTEAQRAKIEQMKSQVAGAVPWTPHDANLVAFSNDPSMTLRGLGVGKTGKIGKDSAGSQVGAATQPPQGAALPQQARSQLKEGVDTTFGNGQVWTLQNGQPVRIK